MVSTRSQDKQTHIEDFTEQKPESKPGATKSKTSGKVTRAEQSKDQSPKKEYARKRKSPPATGKTSSPKTKEPTPKRAKPATNEDCQSPHHKEETASKANKDDQEGEHEDDIIINRAPVLHLWAAAVTQFLYPLLPWSTCLSAGSAVSSICAVAKGRSIGAIEPKETDGKNKQKQASEEEELDEVHVMQFDLRLKNGKAIFSGKPVTDSESGLKGKFGESHYEDVKSTFEDALKSWKGDEEELNKQAFHQYEDFRPNVSKGQKGWGRKGILDLESIKSAVVKAA